MPIHQTITTLNHADGVALPTGMEETGTIERTLYTIDELSGDAKDKALIHFRGINVDHDWWEHIYKDAATIGLEITSFDLSNRKSITGRLKESLRNCCALIRKHHGKESDTFKTARQYLKGYAKAFAAWRANEVETSPEAYEDHSPGDWLDEFDDEDLAEDFRKELLQDYFSMLQDEYEYQTGEEQVLESVRANEYLFTEDGELANQPLTFTRSLSAGSKPDHLMPTPTSEVFTLSLSEYECETIKWSFDKLADTPGRLCEHVFIYDLLYSVVSKPCAYIQMAKENYLKLVMALFAAENGLGYCGRQQDIECLRRRIHQLMVG